jgi:hypothetical protein
VRRLPRTRRHNFQQHQATASHGKHGLPARAPQPERPAAVHPHRPAQRRHLRRVQAGNHTEGTHMNRNPPDQALIDIAERVLAQRLDTAYGLASAACPDETQQKGIDALWQHIGGSWGQFYAHARAIAVAYEDGLALAGKLEVTP